MKKFILASFILLISEIATAQRFFQGFEVVPYLYTDNVYYGARNWKYVFEAPGKPQSANLDSMTSQRKHADKYANYGIQARMLMRLVEFKNPKRATLEWSFGPGYRSFRNSPSDYSTQGYKLPDTTQPSKSESESFDLTYHYFDIYSAITIRNGKGPVHAYLGFGLQASIPVGSRQIEEYYRSNTYQWNPASRRWEQTKQSADYFYSKAVKTNVFSFTVPAGLSFDLGNGSELKFGLEYFNARRSPQIGKNYSEGIMIQTGFRYNLQLAISNKQTCLR